jgi:Phospholipase_D-nuclease N-terminal
MDNMDIPWAALGPVIILMVAFVGYCLFDLSRNEVRHLPKWLWAVIVIISIPVGGIIYLLLGRGPGVVDD